MITAEEYLQIQIDRQVSVSVSGLSGNGRHWVAGVILPTEDDYVFDYREERARHPVEAVERLAVRMGWLNGCC